MFFELRQYRTKPGQREKWVKFMEEEIIPFQVSKGMVILGSFVGQEEDDPYVYHEIWLKPPKRSTKPYSALTPWKSWTENCHAVRGHLSSSGPRSIARNSALIGRTQDKGCLSIPLRR